MPAFLQHRQREPEWMDAPDADPKQLAASLRFIRQVNKWLRYTQASLNHLDQFSRDWKPDEYIRILDVATGSGDIPQAICDWGKRREFKIEIVAIDLHHETLAAATKYSDQPNLKFIRADATHLPFADGSFDYVHTSMFLHHLEEPMVVKVLKEMNRVAARGVIVADLLRSRRAYFWISLFTLLANPMVRHDARVSISGAFSRSELLALRDQAGLVYLQPQEHFGHRLALAGRKSLPDGGRDRR